MWSRSALIVCAGLLAACDQPAPEAESEAQASPGEAQAQASEPAPAEATQSLPRQPAPEGARVYIISPQDGASVTSPVRVVFGLEGAGVAPSGIDREGTGHHHLLVDTDLPDMSRPIPSDEHHIHFGGGQTETTLELEPGMHTLQLILGDHLHIPHDPPLTSERITIEVQ